MTLAIIKLLLLNSNQEREKIIPTSLQNRSESFLKEKNTFFPK